MRQTLRFSQRAGAELVKGGARQSTGGLLLPSHELLFSGVFNVELWRGGKRIDSRRFKNGITIEGKNAALNTVFDGGTQISTWYFLLIDDLNYSALSENDTYDNIDQAGNGWDEYAAYTDPGNADSTTSRPAWTPGAASAKSITNASPVVFDMTATGEVKGIGIVGGTNAQTKSDHTASGNVLWSTALFTGGDVPVENLDQLKVTYTINT